VISRVWIPDFFSLDDFGLFCWPVTCSVATGRIFPLVFSGTLRSALRICRRFPRLPAAINVRFEVLAGLMGSKLLFFLRWRFRFEMPSPPDPPCSPPFAGRGNPFGPSTRGGPSAPFPTVTRLYFRPGALKRCFWLFLVPRKLPRNVF